MVKVMIEEINTLDVNHLLENLDEEIALLVETSDIGVYIELKEKELDSQKRDIILYTEGVGPCIVFLASGQYCYKEDEEQEEYYFSALYHYSGGNQEQLKEEELPEIGKDNLQYFFDDIHERIGEEAIMTLHQLCFIGGQKEDENCCGTEKEVRALKAVFEQEDPYSTILPSNMQIAPSLQPEFRFFLTHGEAFIDVYVQRDGDAGMKVNYVAADDNLSNPALLTHSAGLNAEILKKSEFCGEDSFEQSEEIAKNREYKKESTIEGHIFVPKNSDGNSPKKLSLSSQAAFFHSESIVQVANAGEKHSAPLLANAPAEKRIKTNGVPRAGGEC